MAEIIRFEPRKKKEGGRQGEKLGDAQETDSGNRARLWGRLSGGVQQMLTDRMKEINASQRAGHMRVDDRQLDKQRGIVRGWSDAEVLEFLENSENYERLKTTPHLVLAIFERTLGMI